MSNTAIIVSIIYLGGFAAFSVVCGWVDNDKTDPARGLLMSTIWPLVAVYAFFAIIGQSLKLAKDARK